MGIFDRFRRKATPQQTIERDHARQARRGRLVNPAGVPSPAQDRFPVGSSYSDAGTGAIGFNQNGELSFGIAPGLSVDTDGDLNIGAGGFTIDTGAGAEQLDHSGSSSSFDVPSDDHGDHHHDIATSSQDDSSDYDSSSNDDSSASDSSFDDSGRSFDDSSFDSRDSGGGWD